MDRTREFDYVVLRYAINSASDEGINIGVLMFEEGGQNFGGVRFLKDWKKLGSLQDVDTEFLDGLVRDLEEAWKSVSTREAFLRRMEESWSGQIQITPRSRTKTDQPEKELDRLARLLL